MVGYAIAMTGMKFGRLEVKSRAPNLPNKPARWVCKCSCGSTTNVAGHELRRGRVTSCGCLRRDSSPSRRHGMSGTNKTKEYRAWVNMRYRCLNSDCVDWKNYGGRGLTISIRWSSFENFLTDMGTCPPGLTLERKNNDKGYSPDNCVWATYTAQNRNRRKLRRL